jgi:hypothetical protein
MSHTALDRSLVILLEHPDDTPSRRHHISPRTERLHRLAGTSLIQSALSILTTQTNDNDDCCCLATACTLFHRYYHAVSLQTANVWSVAMASTLLSVKLMEVPNIQVKQVVLVYVHLYKKRFLVSKQQTTTAEKDIDENFCKPSGLSVLGPIYKTWHDALVKTEHLILRALGFVVYWIPKHSPHVVLSTLLVSQQEQDEHVARHAWNYCNDSCRLDLTTRYSLEAIASAALYLARLDAGMACTKCDGAAPCEPQDVANVCNALLSVQIDNLSQDEREACFGFLPSLEKNGSFNDPGSFLWELLEQEFLGMRDE